MGATSLFSKFAKLLDRTTVDLPTLNTPLADALAAKADSSSLSYVALSGSYDDLIDVPSPSPGVSEVADLTDATTYAFPTLNTPLVNALAGKSATGHNHAGVYDPAGSAAAAQAAAIQRANHTGAQAISTVTGLQTAIDGKSSTGHTHSNAEVNAAIAASPATSASAMGLGTGNTPTFAGLNLTGRVNQTGLGNSTYFGDQAGANDDLTSNNNTGVGYQALKSNTTGSHNVASGNNSLLSNTTGSYNVASGNNSLLSNSSGTNNVANGFQSGRYIANGTTANATSSNSVYLGADTKALASGDTNEIVIGYDATGIGSNTVTLGNSSIVTTALRGNVGIGTTAAAVKLHVMSGAITIPSVSTTTMGLFATNGGTRVSIIGNASSIQSIAFGDDSSESDGLIEYANGGRRMSFRTAATEKMTINSTGNVGIGTTSPTEKLDVSGNIQASGVITKGVFVVGTLPSSPSAGMSSYVTDSSQTLAAGIGTTLVAAGLGTEYFNPVHYNGTNWIIG